MISIDTSEFYKNYLRARYGKKLWNSPHFSTHKRYRCDIYVIAETANSNDMFLCLSDTGMLRPVKLIGMALQLIELSLSSYALRYKALKEVTGSVQALTNFHREMESGKVSASARLKLCRATCDLHYSIAKHSMLEHNEVFTLEQWRVAHVLKSMVGSVCIEAARVELLSVDNLCVRMQHSLHALKVAIAGAWGTGVDDDDIAEVMRKAVKEKLCYD